MINNAVTNENGKLVIDGREINQITCVVEILSVDMKQTHLNYVCTGNKQTHIERTNREER
jgi:hypothetical protein